MLFKSHEFLCSHPSHSLRVEKQRTFIFEAIVEKSPEPEINYQNLDKIFTKRKKIVNFIHPSCKK